MTKESPVKHDHLLLFCVFLALFVFLLLVLLRFVLFVLVLLRFVFFVLSIRLTVTAVVAAIAAARVDG